jgi:hypothetical protein
MREALWIMPAALLVAIGAPAGMADSNTYAFVGAGYFAGTDVSITNNGPAVLGTLYSTNPGATDLFVNGIDEGTILGVAWEPSPFFFGTPTLEMYLFTALDLVDGPTIAATGTYTEFFSHGTLTVTAPEPTAFALMLPGLGLLGLIVAMRKRVPVGQSQVS